MKRGRAAKANADARSDSALDGESSFQAEDSNGDTASLELRIRRLEDALASMQDMQAMEDRVVDRVSNRLGRDRPHPVRGTTDMIIEAGRNLLPATIATVQSRPATRSSRTM